MSDATIWGAGEVLIPGPQGPQGEIGPAPTLLMGTVTQGISPAATLVEAPDDTYTLSLTLPRGQQGPTGNPGPYVNLQMGEVTSGDPAQATITGTAPNLFLNIRLPVSTGPQGIQGVEGPPGPVGTPGTIIQRIRDQTDIDGVYEWTFPVPYASGIIPVIEVTVEDSDVLNPFLAKIISVDNLAATIQIFKTVPLTIIDGTVLALDTISQTYIHLIASPP